METVLPLPFIIQSVLSCYVILSSVCFGAVLLLWHEYRYVINIFWMNYIFFEQVSAFFDYWLRYFCYCELIWHIASGMPGPRATISGRSHGK